MQIHRPEVGGRSGKPPACGPFATAIGVDRMPVPVTSVCE